MKNIFNVNGFSKKIKNKLNIYFASNIIIEICITKLKKEFKKVRDDVSRNKTWSNNLIKNCKNHPFIFSFIDFVLYWYLLKNIIKNYDLDIQGLKNIDEDYNKLNTYLNSLKTIL